MHSIDKGASAGGRLRIVFSDQVVSCQVPAGMTLGKIAERFDAVSERRLGEPIAVDLTLRWPVRGAALLSERAGNGTPAVLAGSIPHP